MKRPYGCWLLLLAMVLAAGCAARQGSGTAAKPSRPPVVVAVLDFRNDAVDPELDYLVQAIPETLIRHLGRSKELVVVERAALLQALKGLKIKRMAIVDDGIAAMVGRAVGASVVVTGSFVKIGSFGQAGNPIVVATRLVDVPSQQGVPFQQVRGIPGVELFDLIDQTALRLLKHIVP